MGVQHTDFVARSINVFCCSCISLFIALCRELAYTIAGSQLDVGVEEVVPDAGMPVLISLATRQQGRNKRYLSATVPRI